MKAKSSLPRQRKRERMFQEKHGELNGSHMLGIAPASSMVRGRGGILGTEKGRATVIGSEVVK